MRAAECANAPPPEGAGTTVPPTEHQCGAQAVSLPPEKPTDHARTIAFLARESAVSIDEVTRLYERERTELEAGARIKHFLPILAIRNVRAALRHRPLT